MTNRDPNVPDYMRKVNDYFDCVANYFKISDIDKLKKDISKPDINLVCFYELNEIRKHARETGLTYIDFVKVPYVEERKFLAEINSKKF